MPGHPEGICRALSGINRHPSGILGDPDGPSGIRRGLRNCFWLMSPASNVVKVREDQSLREAKSKYKG